MNFNNNILEYICLMDHQDYTSVDVGNPKLKALKNQKNNKEIISKNLKNTNILQATGKKLKEDEEGFSSLSKDDYVGLTIGKKISQARVAKKLSQKQLAQQLNIQPVILQTYESGKALRNNSMLSKIEKALGTKVR